MSNTKSIKYHLFLFLGLIFFQSCSEENKQNIPFHVKKDLFDTLQPKDLGLQVPKGIETHTIFKPTDSTDHFSNGAVMTAFKGELYCQWQSSSKDEDSDDTWVAYSKSTDGIHWSKPMVLSASLEEGYCTSGGWWTHKDSLIAFVNVWPSKVSPKGGFTHYKTSADGLNWSKENPVLMANNTAMNAVFEQDPHQLANGRIINAAHFQPGLQVSPIYTDDPKGVSGWTRALFRNNSEKNNVSQEIEPSSFSKKDNTLVMVFRDQFSSFQTLASISKDNGKSWTTPVETKMPDSRSKQSAGNFPDGSAYIINNPVQSKTRMPLAVTLSNDGNLFTNAYMLRKGGDAIQPLQYQGKYKRLGYHYPKSFIFNDNLYVSYTTNKEDVEYTKVPLSSLKITNP
ncbi:exo-alpha-sialidase [Winogradskyella echinorum]|uniref:Exo-alpha-sialidase n=1 Tax=Winogradskyella echinorum TaxID=538189 RepID=A0ABR6XX19_9FLAO|nr:exo-alpha-sialidase [Winogradskyella echinorum]MBC3845021.1 exo-alpha-sialidase [Winogradskyella echinorum]MBC5749369.1 exo-alpha-sialidase [Winogradskyella echinorum]